MVVVVGAHPVVTLDQLQLCLQVQDMEALQAAVAVVVAMIMLTMEEVLVLIPMEAVG